MQKFSIYYHNKLDLINDNKSADSSSTKDKLLSNSISKRIRDKKKELI